MFIIYINLRSSSFLRSSSWSGWQLRNIYFSNDNEYFPLCVDLLFPLSPTRLLTDFTMRWVCYKNRNFLPFTSTCFHSRWLDGVCRVHLFRLCVFCFVLCLMCPILPMSPNCPFVIALSVSCNIYSVMRSIHKLI